MIDLRAARNDPDTASAPRSRARAPSELFDKLLAADERWRELETRASELRAQRKISGKPTPEQLEELNRVKAELQQVEEELAAAERERQQWWDLVPNPPDPSAPDGSAEEDAVELRRVGEPRDFGFEPLDHLELAGGGIDMERGARVSGSRFVYRKGDFALLELALYRFALDRLVAKGFVPVLPPVLVRETGDVRHRLPADRRGQHLPRRARRALPDRHVRGGPGRPAHGRDPRGDELPLRYAGYSTSFRREAGAAGRTRAACSASTSSTRSRCSSSAAPRTRRRWHERLLAIEEELVGELGIPYRVVNVAAGDLGASATKKYDIEAWFPAQERYREITSTSNTTDYQARRLDIRFRRDGKPELVHTLNGTAVTARALLAVLENFQEEGGSVAIPGVLGPFGAPPGEHPF